MKVLITTGSGLLYSSVCTKLFILSQSEAFGALVESQDEHAAKFVVCFVGWQIQLIETVEQQTTNLLVNKL